MRSGLTQRAAGADGWELAMQIKEIHTSPGRLDGRKKLTGEARYGADICLPGMAHACGVCFRVPHARFGALDTAACLAVPGVLGVFSAADLPGRRTFGMMTPDEPIFPENEVKYAGDVVALVVAESVEAARRGGSLVRAELTPLPAVLDMDEARLARVVVNDAYPDNVCSHTHLQKGDPERGFAEADAVIDAVYETSRVEHAYLEPDVVLVIPRGGDKLEIRGSMQHPFYTRQVVADALSLPLAQIVVRPDALGGSFGGKVEIIAAMAARAAVAARALGRPVRYLLSREESMEQRHKRHGIRFSVRLGAKKTGELTALTVDARMDGGAYVNESPIVAWKTVTCGQGPYRIPNVLYDTRAVMTNNVPCGAMRGFGTPQAIFAMESAMNELAQKLGLSPLALRQRNLLKPGDSTATGHVLNFGAVSSLDVAERAASDIGFDEKFLEYFHPQTGRFRRGVGVACSLRGVSFGADAPDVGRARIRLLPDGTAQLFCPMMDMGQGSDTALAQIAADALGLPLSSVSHMPPETAENPDTGAAGASRGTFIGGNAILACVQNLAAAVADVLDVPAGQVRFAGGCVQAGGKQYPYRTVCERFAARGLEPDSTGEYAVRGLDWDHAHGQGEAYISYTYSAQAAEVEVDTETGKTRLVNLSACHDAGRVIHPQMAAGQVSGGLAMGAGMALIERVELDGGTGEVRNTNFDTYLIPTAADVGDMRISFIENPDDAGPFGGKSLGEPAMEPSCAAILAAVNMALGGAGAIRRMPADLETVFFAAHPECEGGGRR